MAEEIEQKIRAKLLPKSVKVADEANDEAVAKEA